LILDRDELWDKFANLVMDYAALLGESDIFAFASAMHRTPLGNIADPAYSETYYRLFPDNALPACGKLYSRLADFVEQELIGEWRILTAQRLANDLRLASSDPNGAPEPLRSWKAALS
jgi:hypothetical protein